MGGRKGLVGLLWGGVDHLGVERGVVGNLEGKV